MRILVTAASKHGATDEIADAIAHRLGEYGIDVERRDPDEIGELDAYDGVVLGSAVYAGHWLKPALDLAEEHALELKDRPVWLFSSGPIGGKPAEGPDLPVGLTFSSHHVFGGKIDRTKLSLGERAVAKLVRAPDGDFRDWAEVDDCADAIASGVA